MSGHSRGRIKWAVDFSEIRRKHERSGRVAERSSPPGYMDIPPKEDTDGKLRSQPLTESTETADDKLVAKLGWSIALGPWKQLPLNIFVLWMAGNSISLFPIMMVGMMFVRPVQTIFSYKDVFRRLTGDQAVLQKMVYVLANLVGIGLAIYKCNSMGLLPTAQSDWLEFMAARQNMELTGGGLVYS